MSAYALVSEEKKFLKAEIISFLIPNQHKSIKGRTKTDNGDDFIRLQTQNFNVSFIKIFQKSNLPVLSIDLSWDHFS